MLVQDTLWKRFLNFVYLNGGWQGPDIPWDPKEPVAEGVDECEISLKLAAMQDITAFMERFSVLKFGREEGSAEKEGYAVNRVAEDEWREEDWEEEDDWVDTEDTILRHQGRKSERWY